MARRRRYAVLAASIILAASTAPSIPAAQETKRVRANNPDNTPPGALFTAYDQARGLGDEEGNIMVAAIGGPEAVAGLSARMEAMGPDGHAAEFVFGYNGQVRSDLQMRWVAELYEDGATTEVLRNHWVRTRTSEGEQEMPLLAAASLHWLTMHMAANARAEAPVPEALDGTYLAVAAGECPFGSGRIAFARRAFLVEGRRGDALLLMGALGERRAYFVANEQYHLTVTAHEEGIELEVPDAPNEMWEAALDGGQLTLEGRLLERCTITLTPVE